MDPVLSTLFPTYNIGSDGFNWFIGQVENVTDTKGSGRIQVRIVGVHHREGQVTPTKQLPWANVMLPVNVPYSNGASAGSNNLQIGAWVIGFYLDNEGQKPMILGSIAHTASSTYEELQEWTPDLESLGFKPTRVIDINPFANRSITDIKNGRKDGNENGAVTDAGEAKIKGAYCPAILVGLKRKYTETNPTGSKTCVKIADAKCDAKDLGTGIKKIIGDLLAANQSAGGSLGSYYVSKINGELYSAIDIPRNYLNKLTRLISSFSLRIKKEIVYGIREGIEALVKLIMGVQTAKEVAEKATDKPKNPKESVVPNTERGNFLKKAIEVFNKILNEIGCSFTKTLDDLIKFIVDLVMEYLQDAFNAAFCLIDNIVSQTLTFLESSFNTLISTVLEPLQSLLGEAGSFVDIIGGTINRVLNLLGISCTGVKDTCNKNETDCTDGSTDDKKKDEKDFLDKLIEEIETGSLTGKELGAVSRGVCNDARSNPTPTSTSVEFVGGILNKPVQNDYVSVTDLRPDIALGSGEYPSDIPSAVPVPDASRDTSNYSEYTVTRLKDKIKEGETAQFQLDGPDRNGVLEIEILSSSTIPSEAGNIYEECEITSNDGIAYGLVVQVNRNQAGVPLVTIVQPGVGFMVGMEFTLLSSKIGGTGEGDNIKIRIKLVGASLTYRIFGDVYDKNLIDEELYPEFRTFTYTEPRTFSFPTIDAATNSQPSYIGLEILQKRAADSIVIWDDDPEDEFRQEPVELKTVEITTVKDEFVEGENIFYTVTTDGYVEGTVFDYKIFGTVNKSDYEIYNDTGKVTISDNKGEIIVLTNIDDESEEDELMTLILFEENTETPVASKLIFLIDRNKDTDVVTQDFVLTPSTTNEQFQEYLSTIKLTEVKDFGSTQIPLPPGSGALPPSGKGENEPDDFQPPVAGPPVVDEDGSIISIPIDYEGNKSYQVPPKVVISGEGYGAAAIALLNADGFLSEIRVTRIGLGYVPNLPDDNGLSCIIDSFTIIRPGFGYVEPPIVYVDGDPNIAEITINDDGFIDGVKVLNRSKNFNTIPEILVVGGGGAGGFVLPSLVCLPPLELEQKGYVKIGTGSYIDCP